MKKISLLTRHYFRKKFFNPTDIRIEKKDSWESKYINSHYQNCWSLVTHACSGVSWLMNCFIELGIHCDTHATHGINAFQNTRDKIFSKYMRNSDPAICYLPILEREKNFLFRNDFFCYFSEHRLPELAVAKKLRTIILIRDPRDTLYSYGHIAGAENNIDGYIKRYVYEWKTFYEYCLSLPNVKFFKFEDYKKDPVKHLKNILSYCEIKVTDEAILAAVKNSTSEKAKAVEERYLTTPNHIKEHKGNYNRSGAVNQWKGLLEKHRETFLYVQRVAGEIMTLFGYEMLPDEHAKKKGNPVYQFLKKFTDTLLVIVKPSLKKRLPIFSSTPIIVDVINEFNIIHYQSYYCAVAQVLGPIDFSVHIMFLQDQLGKYFFVDHSLRRVREYVLKNDIKHK